MFGRLTRRTWLLIAAAAAAVVIVIGLVIALGSNEDETGEVTAGTITTSTVAERTTTTTTTPPGETTTTAVQTTEPSFRYLPLYPFADEDEVAAWQESMRTGGHQPWHGDAEQTALSFVGFLGFTEIDRVITSDIGATEAHVAVGYDTDNGQSSTAANIHLARYGSPAGGIEAPWEVVGTADTDLTLEAPRYGATIRSPVTVGGHITGVDESLDVQVRQLSSARPLGEACCLPAGGESTPWQTTVSFTGATDPALIIVVSTGGHYQGVERFAITGVRH